MKPIEERAHYCADRVLEDVDPADALLFRKLIVESYSVGAIDEQKELLRWRTPDEELPTNDVEVLCKVQHPHRTYDVLRHDKFGWWKEAPGGGWCAACWEVKAWRPIFEKE